MELMLKVFIKGLVLLLISSTFFIPLSIFLDLYEIKKRYNLSDMKLINAIKDLKYIKLVFASDKKKDKIDYLVKKYSKTQNKTRRKLILSIKNSENINFTGKMVTHYIPKNISTGVKKSYQPRPNINVSSSRNQWFTTDIVELTTEQDFVN